MKKGIAFSEIHARIEVHSLFAVRENIYMEGKSWLTISPMLASSAVPALTTAPLRLSPRATRSTSSMLMFASAAVHVPTTAPLKLSRKADSSESAVSLRRPASRLRRLIFYGGHYGKAS